MKFYSESQRANLADSNFRATPGDSESSKKMNQGVFLGIMGQVLSRKDAQNLCSAYPEFCPDPMNNDLVLRLFLTMNPSTAIFSTNNRQLVV